MPYTPEERKRQQESFERIDAKLPDEVKFQALDRVPTEAGYYVDNRGFFWYRAADGHWYDGRGETNPVSYNYILGLEPNLKFIGPFKSINELLALLPE